MSNKARRLLEIGKRLVGSARATRSDADIEAELRSHLALAAEGGREARLRAGGLSQAMDRVRDQRSLPSLDAIAADIVFGWRQLLRHRAASVPAILSLGLAMGATLAAFQLVDAVLLRPMPVADPASLFVLTTTVRDQDDRLDERDDFDYPTYRRYVETAGDRARLMVVGAAVRRQIVIDGNEPEIVVGQFVSGHALPTLGAGTAAGRLLGPSDDVTPDGHPVAVITHDFWIRRFGGDPSVIGRTFRIGSRPIEIVGVTAKGFTGTEPGLVTDFFQPAMMNPEALNAAGWSWFRIWARPAPGVTRDEVQALLHARFHADHVEHAKTFGADTPRSRIDAYLNEQLSLRPAGAGVSALQKSFRRPLWILATLAAIVLLIACANVANLLLARSMSRRVEMALRVSIGAGRGRLVQLMLVESALLALVASAAGALFAAWASPFVVSMLAPAERPVRLMLDVDWRMVTLAASLTFLVTMLFGLVPALRASAVTPLDTLKETRAARAQRGLTDALVIAQMALCVFLLFGASLFVGTFERLQRKPLGFEPGSLTHVVVEGRDELQPAVWEQIAARVRELPRVEAAAFAGWAPLTGNRWRSSVSVPGRESPTLAPNWVGVSGAYFDAMRMPLVDGRTFRPDDRGPRRGPDRKPIPGVGIVNQAFARVYFDGQNPVGRQVTVDSSRARLEIVGLVADAVYFNVREAMHPAVFVPLEVRENATLMVRSAAGEDVGPVLKREIARSHPGLHVRGAERFENFVSQQMVRERLLAALSSFFALLALLVAVIGMYGVLNYAVTRERREIAVRMALGARPAHVVGLITRRLVVVISAGAVVGIAGGVMFGRYVRTLLFDTVPADPIALALPIAVLAAAAAIAAFAPALRATRIDPALTIKAES